MSGPHRTPDKINTIGIVVVGICGSVLVYVSIVALQAFYMDDSSETQTMQDYGGQDDTFKSIRADQLRKLKTYAPHPAPQPKEGEPAPPQRYMISIDDAIPLVVRGAKQDPSNLVPAIGPATTPSVQPIFGRPRPLQVPAPAGAAPAEPAGAAPADVQPAQDPPGAAPAPAAPAPAAPVPTRLEPPPAQPKVTPAPVQPKATPAPAQPKAAPAQPKAAPVQPKAAPAQPKAAPAQPKAAPAQPKKGNAP